MGGTVVADVDDLVADQEMRLADPRLDPAAEKQLLAEDRGLPDLALRVERTLIAFPALAVSGEACRPVGDAAVQAEGLGLLRG